MTTTTIPTYREWCKQEGLNYKDLRAHRIYQSEINPKPMTGVVVNNTHFVCEKGNPYEIETVEGYTKDGTEAVFHSWNFPENHPAQAVHTITGKVTII